MVPKDVRIQILRTCEYVALCGKRDLWENEGFWDGDYPGLFKWANVITRKAGGWKSEKGDLRMQAQVGAMCFEDGGRGHEPRNPGGRWKQEKAGEQEFWKECRARSGCLLSQRPFIKAILGFITILSISLQWLQIKSMCNRPSIHSPLIPSNPATLAHHV